MAFWCFILLSSPSAAATFVILISDGRKSKKKLVKNRTDLDRATQKKVDDPSGPHPVETKSVYDLFKLGYN